MPSKNFGPVSPKVRRILHGGDYNPDQWLDHPEVLKQDTRLMKLARVNAVSLNIFGWAAIEKVEGRFDFGWLDRAIADIAKNGGQVVLATPSGSKPAWMSQKYPEIRRVGRDGLRQAHGGRHNNCFSSPVYREKVRIMNTKLAERYGQDPAVVMWHVSNEYNGGECHCDLCYARFRGWLKARYGTLERLNQSWWNSFWSHAYTDWSQVEPRDWENLGQELDWKRFISDLCLDFFKAEIKPLKKLTPAIPVTTNFMGAYFGGLDYWKLAAAEDVCSWDSYPAWHKGDDVREASLTGLSHDVMRSMKGGKPFMLMESTPEGTNWMEVGKTKRPGMHLASTLQAVAHGSDTMMYFQWRKGRGGFEQFHGAVVDHAGHENTRVFREVAATGALGEKLTDVLGTGVPAEAAFIWDWDTRWMIELAKGPRHTHKDHDQDMQEHYFQFWRRGIAMDAVNLEHDLSGYRILVAPNLYQVTEAFAARLREFVKKGGVLVTGHLAGTVDENALCHRGGRPGLIRDILGIWAEETDVLTEAEQQTVQAAVGNRMGLTGSYAARHYADLLHLEGARALARYGGSWYAGSPAVTENLFGRGRAYCLASRNSREFLDDFYGGLFKTMNMKGALARNPPEGVEACRRGDGKNSFLFLINFTQGPRTVALGTWKGALDLVSGKKAASKIQLGAYEVSVLRKAAR